MRVVGVINESLSYKVKDDSVKGLISDHKYVEVKKEGNSKFYAFKEGEEPLFSYDKSKHTLVVLKQGFQLLNIIRGY